MQWPQQWIESIQPQIKESIKDGLFYLIQEQNKVVAVVELKTQTESIWDNDQTPAVYIHKIAIERKLSNQGLGNRILNKTEHFALQQNINTLRLDCVAHNPKLRGFYESYGFEFIKEVDIDVVVLALYEFRITRPK